MEEFVRNRYEIIDLVGQGATSKVYKVIKEGRTYALKVSENLKLLREEADFLKNASCKVFPKCYDWMEGEQGYLIMDYIEGCDLQEIMNRGVIFSVDEALWITETVLQGLDYLHRQSPCMVYRDLKPSNVVVERSGRIWLIDFGSLFCEAGKEKSNSRAGTYGYAAPEQFWENMKPTPDWDVYAAGKMLGYMITGENPAIPPYEVADLWKGDKRIPGAFREVLQRCLSENKEVRYENAGELLRALRLAKDNVRKRNFGRHQEIKYKKCIWLSEYRRIF